jgi:DNA-binding MarR family transcriptional regulator
MQASRPRANPAASIERELTLLVRRAQKVALRGGQLERPVDRGAYAILGHLADAGPQRPSAVADHFYLDPSTISRQTSALISAGLVKRVADDTDGRASLLELTPGGKQVLAATRAERRRVVQDLLDTWPAEDLNAFARLLSAFNAGLDRQFDGHPRVNEGASR